MALVTYDPEWHASPSLLMFDALAQPVLGGDTPPLWEVDISLDAYQAAAPERNRPAFRARHDTNIRSDMDRADVSVSPDGNRVLVWLQPAPDSDKCGLWLFDGQGHLLRTIVFPARYPQPMVANDLIKRSERGGWWAVNLTRAATPAESSRRGDLAGAAKPHPKWETEVVDESYIIDQEGRVVGRTVNNQGQDVRLGTGGWWFSQNDEWAWAQYSLSPSSRDRNVGCYYDLRPLSDKKALR